MNNVSYIHGCFGCGVCAAACARKCIRLKMNKQGFYEPFVHLEDCVDCGICRKVCSFINETELLPFLPQSYEAWSNDGAIRHTASSGGIGFELARMCVEKGFQAVVVRYNTERKRAEHYVASGVEDLMDSIGSKYIQSYTLEALRQINFKQRVFFVGTPCQVASLRRWIRMRKAEDSFVLVDFFCHGVPSALAWKNYLKIHEGITGNLTDVSWRDKDTGWHDSWAMLLRGNKGTVHVRRSEGDLFYSIFLGGWCMNPACSKQCKFKYDKSLADIRIGDLWGYKYRNEKEGVSALVAFTEKGEETIASLQRCTTLPSTFEVVAEGQMRNNAKGALLAPLVMRRLSRKNYLSMKEWNRYNRMEFYTQIPFLALRKLSKIIKR